MDKCFPVKIGELINKKVYTTFLIELYGVSYFIYIYYSLQCKEK